MRKTPQYLEMSSGDTLQITQSVKNAAGTAKNLTGATVTFGVFPKGSTKAQFTKTVGSGITLLTQSGTTLGHMTIDIDPGDTANLSGRYKHETEVTDSSGNKATTAFGPFQIFTDSIE